MIQNDNFSVYTLSTEINLLEFNPKYPKNPKTLGEKIRKARMDKRLEIKELAELIGVTPDSVINWEIRGVKPREESLKKLTRTLDFL
ncbi:MAG: helix-turn-helix transcriptional regulator [Candidatus Omnitrophica bacterium]|nr:helix-turn-helix transcriptional regulator [Candidatus Omnitrophota bacterium]